MSENGRTENSVDDIRHSVRICRVLTLFWAFWIIVSMISIFHGNDPMNGIVFARLGFFTGLAVLLLSTPKWLGVWSGSFHLRKSVSLLVPVQDSSFRDGAAVNPGRSRFGVSGRAALLGEVLFYVMLLLLSAALGVMPLDETGEMHVNTGEVTGALEVGDSGLRISLAQQYRLVHVDRLSSTARVEVEYLSEVSPDTYDLILGEQVTVGAHRVHLERTLPSGIVLRFERQHLLYWKLFIGLGMIFAIGLLVMIPHRSWVWLGQPGRYVIRVWSMNRSGSVERWTQRTLSIGLDERTDLKSIRKLDLADNRPVNNGEET